MTKVNRKWHDKNRVPKGATTKQRVKWYLVHAKSCACRPVPAKIQRAIDKQSADKSKKSEAETKKPAAKTPKKKK